VCLRADAVAPEHCWSAGPVLPWHTPALRTAYRRLPEATKRAWLWWNPPIPPHRRACLADLIEEAPTGVKWFTSAEVGQLTGQMSERNQARLKAAQLQNRRIVGAVYRRTRPDESGCKVQRAEVRFDDVSGCLRTPAGGSSRQIILIVEGSSIKARLISARETARLMGLPDSYVLPDNYNEGYHLTGDGVVVPVVRHLAHHILEPAIARNTPERQVAA
jgi:DNA (cytosine-5)-methyltransferase 1